MLASSYPMEEHVQQGTLQQLPLDPTLTSKLIGKWGQVTLWVTSGQQTCSQWGQYTAHAVVLTKILSQPLRQNVLFSP